MTADTEPRYTLAEARQVLARREAARTRRVPPVVVVAALCLGNQAQQDAAMAYLGRLLSGALGLRA